MLDNILMALQSLRANKMRALLTMLGIIIGIGSVIAIETVGGSLSGSITTSMSGFGASDITVSLTQKEDEARESGGRVLLFMRAEPSESDRITDTMLAEYRTAFPKRVAYIKLSEAAGSVSFSSDDSTANLTVTGVNDEYLIAEQVELLYGRAIRNETDGSSKLCYLADDFIQEYLGIAPVQAVGQSITLSLNGRPHTFYIVGVYQGEAEDTATVVSMGGTSSSCYIPLETARQLSGTDTGYESLTVVAQAGTDTNAFLSTTEQFFASYYTQNNSWTVTASSMESLISTMTEMLDTVALAISAIAAISLLVGGIGVMNIMLVSVTERTREIGTRKALGAPPSSIRMQFVVEAVVICLIGGILGILTGLGLGAIACSLLGYSTIADTATITLVVVISMAIGVFFGYYPANKAAKLDPIEALRYE